MDLNIAVVIGRLTKTPEVQTSARVGKTLCNFTIACDRRKKPDGEQLCDFIDCVAFGKTAEFMGKYLNRGDKICVTGNIRVEKYNGKDGKAYISVKIVANEIKVIAFAKASNQNMKDGGALKSREAQNEVPLPDDNDLYAGYEAYEETDNLPF